jgi:hypothetical protein
MSGVSLGGQMSKILLGSMVFAPIAAVMLLSRAASAQQDQDFSKVQIKVTKVSGNIYMLEGAGGNIGASVARMASSLWTTNLRRSPTKSRRR